MWQFIKYVLATIVGLLLFSIVGSLILIGIAASSSGDSVEVKPKSVLKLSLSQPVQEIGLDNPLAALGGPFAGGSESTGLNDIRTALANAKIDPNVSGVYLNVENVAAGWATLQEIRDALIDFKKSKKFVYAYGEFMTEKGYYINSIADKIYLNPAGGMEWNGLSAEYDFYKGTLDKLGVKPVIFRVGDYKSAVEPFLRTDMSDASKAQTRSYLNSINDYNLTQVAQSRKISVAKLKALADSLTIDSPAEALKSGLVTHVGYLDELETAIKKELSLEDSKKIKYLSLSDYLKAEKMIKESESDNRIAVIVGEGSIVSGDGGDDMIGSDKIAAQIKKAREDKRVKAIVLRVNSGGGSSLASDVMWREVKLTRGKKPIIGSMSDVAASGGYYMLMDCDKIVAHPNTITGSIGIFLLLFNAEGFFNDKLGVNFDRVNTNAHSDFPTVTRTLSDFENKKLQKGVDAGYATFTSKAAQGRKMSVEKLRSIASGRVWSGAEAKQNGLIDELGGLEDAIRLAAKSAKLNANDYQVKYYPEKRSVFDDFFKKVSADAEERAVKAQLGNLAPYAKAVQRLNSMQGMQARMESFDIR